MKNVQELNEKVAVEIASFARLHSVTPDQVTGGFWDCVEVHMSKDNRNVSEVVKRAAAVRFVAHHYPFLHLQLRQQLLAEATLSDSERRSRAAKTEEEKKDYTRFLYEPLTEEGVDSDAQT